MAFPEEHGSDSINKLSFRLYNSLRGNKWEAFPAVHGSCSSVSLGLQKITLLTLMGRAALLCNFFFFWFITYIISPIIIVPTVMLVLLINASFSAPKCLQYNQGGGVTAGFLEQGDRAQWGQVSCLRSHKEVVVKSNLLLCLLLSRKEWNPLKKGPGLSVVELMASYKEVGASSSER